MVSSQHVELEAAKFLHRLIQESKDEPAKLATKLYVICQHMKSNGKEQSLPYQVISRAMETVICQHGLDRDALKSTPFPLGGSSDSSYARLKDKEVPETCNHDAVLEGASVGTWRSSSTCQFNEETARGTGQNFGNEGTSSIASGDVDTTGWPLLGSNKSQNHGQDVQQSSPQRSSKSLDHGSPTSLQIEETSVSQELQYEASQKDTQNMGAKRKRIDNRATQNQQISNASSTRSNIRKTKQLKKGDTQGPHGSSSAITSSGINFKDGSCGAMDTNKQGLHAAINIDVSGKPTVGPSNPSSVFSMSKGVDVTGSCVSGRGEILDDKNKNTFKRFSEAHFNAQSRDVKANVDMASSVRMANVRDVGGASGSQASPSCNMPFKEHQLKQLRAQCLVFLAFRNNMVPRKLHLEIALGESQSREGAIYAREVAIKGKDTLANESSSSHDYSAVADQTGDITETGLVTPVYIANKSPHIGNLGDSSRFLRDVQESKKRYTKPETAERSQLSSPLSQKMESEPPTLDTISQSPIPNEMEGIDLSNLQSSPRVLYKRDFSECSGEQFSCLNNPPAAVSDSKMSLDGNALVRAGVDGFKDAYVASAVQMQHDNTSSGRIDGDILSATVLSKSDSMCTSNKHESSVTGTIIPTFQAKDANMTNSFPELENLKHIGSICLKDRGPADLHSQSTMDGFKTIIFNDTQKSMGVNMSAKSVLHEDGKKHEQGKNHEEGKLHEEEKKIHCNESLACSKLTTVEKWIMDLQSRKQLENQIWTLKQRKAEAKIAKCFNRTKENVSTSEDVSKRTNSVIQLKKLQLLQLQRRLRSDFLSDFFKPISSDMERLNSIKKNKHGRRMKQLEKFELKMKEERQRRIKERQKEFFSELEAHRERLEDSFKVKRERLRGFNKHVKELHKRKERIHREKIDRIQREKINLLKNNDVEGYLRMVQDAKSDRVKQLLKETEKYLQQLGSKLQDAKAMARKLEIEMDENRGTHTLEQNYELFDSEDASDETMHYLESNEKYYLMAHTVKESIEKQPVTLRGGKLREYQMNGLRWLVSLYNNNLNGILADEMGLGKTVQVISLLCHLMEMKNDRGPFLVVVPSSVLHGWESELSFWAPEINKIVYAGPPEERRRLFKEMIARQKFNVLLTTYEFLMNKHDRPKLSKIHWHYVIIDEGHRIKNASCKLNADLKHYQSSHRLLLTGTPLQNNLEELWALLNFLLPSIFNSAEDFSQWFNKPFESNGDNSMDEALLSEEENLLIINRLHQVLRPFVLRRLKHKVENELPEKIERLVRCEASAYQKLLMKRVEENLGSLGNSKGRTVHNSVMELRNICNHPYLSQLHAEEVDSLIPKHYLPPIVRLCGKLEMLDRLLPKLKATNHRVLLFSTMTRLLDVLEEYLTWKHYRYLRLDGHTSGHERGALIGEFNRPDSATFIFLLSIRAGGVGVNLQAADTVIIFDTDWNPQVDLQAQARAHRIGQKRDVLVLRLETVRSVEEQVRAAAEHKLGVANQSITAGFFDNNTSAEDRREYLESLLRVPKKEEAAHVLDDDALNDILARSESEIDIFEAIDKQRREDETAAWQKLTQDRTMDGQDPVPMPPRLVTEEDLKPLYLALQISETSNPTAKRKGESIGSLDTQQYGRGKRAREVRSYDDPWTEEEFEKLCQGDSPESSGILEVMKDVSPVKLSDASEVENHDPFIKQERDVLLKESQSQGLSRVVTSGATPVKRGRGRPRRVSTSPLISSPSGIFVKQEIASQKDTSLVSANDMKSSSSVSFVETPILKQESADRIINTASATCTVPVKRRVQTRRTKAGETARSHIKKDDPELAMLETCHGVTPALDVVRKQSGRVRGRKSITINAPIRYEVKSISTTHATAIIGTLEAPMPSQQLERDQSAERTEVEKPTKNYASASKSPHVPPLEAPADLNQSSLMLVKMDHLKATMVQGETQKSPSAMSLSVQKAQALEENNGASVSSCVESSYVLAKSEISGNDAYQDSLSKQELGASDSKMANIMETSCSGKDLMEPNAVIPSKQNNSNGHIQQGYMADINSGCLKHDAQSTLAPIPPPKFSVEENNLEAVIVRRRSAQKSSVTSKKAAARGPRHAGSFQLASCVTSSNEPRHDKSKKAASKNRVGDKMKNDSNPAQIAASISIHSAREIDSARTSPDVSPSSSEMHGTGVSQSCTASFRDVQQNKMCNLSKAGLSEPQCFRNFTDTTLMGSTYFEERKKLVPIDESSSLSHQLITDTKENNSVSIGNSASLSKNCSVSTATEIMEDDSADEDSIPPGFGSVLFPPHTACTSHVDEDSTKLLVPSVVAKNVSISKEASFAATRITDAAACDVNQMLEDESIVDKKIQNTCPNLSADDFSVPPGFSPSDIRCNERSSEDSGPAVGNIENHCRKPFGTLFQDPHVTFQDKNALENIDMTDSLCKNIGSPHLVCERSDLSSSNQHVETVVSLSPDKSSVAINSKLINIEIGSGIGQLCVSASASDQDCTTGSGSGVASSHVEEKLPAAAISFDLSAQNSAIASTSESSMMVVDDRNLLSISEVPKSPARNAISDDDPSNRGRDEPSFVDSITEPSAVDDVSRALNVKDAKSG